jgi:hypothetical protein
MPKQHGLRPSAWLAPPAVILTSAVLCGCAGNLGDSLPQSMGGMPAGAPERPAADYAYPAVHDMPPERPVPTLSEDQQQRVERELAAARDRQRGGPPKKPPKAAAGTF